MKRIFLIAVAAALFSIPSMVRASTDPRLRKALPAPPGTTTISGVVRNYTHTPNGAIDGFILDNGMVVRLPPNTGVRASQVVGPRHQVRIDGRIEQTPDQPLQIDADSISDVASGKTLFLPGSRTSPLW